MKIREHKHLFRALGTIVSRQFGHSLISHKQREHCYHLYLILIRNEEKYTHNVTIEVCY